MKWSVMIKNSLVAFSTLLCMLAATSSLQAQSQEVNESRSVNISTTKDGKVQLKVTIKKGNDETNFEKTYDSHEEMYNDPDLEKYGIDLGFGSGGFGSSTRPQFYFHQGPGGKFWDDDAFGFEMEEMRKRMEEMMGNFKGPGFFFDDDNFMDMDSLVQKFQFKNDNGRFFFNGEEIMDIDSLEEAMRDQFGQMSFDFDFGGWTHDFNQNDQQKDVRVITRAKVYVRSAREEDKEVVGTDEMESLELNDISFYPNPSDGRFDLELKSSSEEAIQLIIVDEEGNEVYNKLSKPEQGFLTERIDLSGEGRGIYIMKVMQNGKALTKRIIIE